MDVPSCAASSATWRAVRVAVPSVSIAAVKPASPGRSIGFSPLPLRTMRFAETTGSPGRSVYRTVSPFASR